MTHTKWTWQHTFMKDKSLAPATKHILHALGCYMSMTGQSCFPTIETLMEDTGYSKPTIINHITLAVEAGYLIKKLHGYSGQKWRRLEYVARFPDSGLEGHDMSAEDGKTDLPPQHEKVVKPVSEGGKIDSEKVVKEVYQYNNRPENIPENRPNLLRDLPEKRKIDDDFQDFWNGYNHKIDRKKAFAAYRKARKTTSHEQIMAGIPRYDQYLQATGYAKKHPSSWLNGGCWEDDYTAAIATFRAKQTGYVAEVQKGQDLARSVLDEMDAEGAWSR